MSTNTSATSSTSQNLDPFGDFARKHKVESVKWETSLAIAGYTGGNIERLRPLNTTAALEAAMGYAIIRGWKVFPADTEAKKSYLSAEHAPGHLNWGMTDDPEQLQRNFVNAKWRLKCGVAIPTGWVNRIFDIEADTIKGHEIDGLKSLQELEAKHGKLPDTLMAMSPSGSVHRIYQHPGLGIKVRSFTLVAGVDIRGDGGMFIAPPSVRGDGAYCWLNNLPIAEAPQWLIELVRDDAPRSTDHNDPWVEGVHKPLTEAEKTAGCIAIRDHYPNKGKKGDGDSWEDWCTVGMKIYTTVPDERGFEAFRGYSQRSKAKNNNDRTAAKWKDYSKTPPTKISAGSFIYLVNKAIGVGWRDRIAPDEAEDTKPRCSLDDVHKVFRKWLGETYDLDVIDATCAAAAAERLGGDPLWLQIISGPGAAKTETAQSLAGAGAHIISTIASEGALLSGSPNKNRAKTATGGLLRKIGERGILVIKDFTSIMSADRNTRGTVLAAIREIYDGHYDRNVGSDGGQSLTWKGRIAIVAACTTAWDSAHAVVAVMGDRFVIIRIDSGIGRIASGMQAIRNTGSEVQMREELAVAVGGLIAHASTDDVPVSEDERTQLLKAADIVTRARTAVERDYQGNVIDAHAPEMPTRFAKQLTQMVRGGVAIGMSREAAMKLAIRCARDSIPPLRLGILRDLAVNSSSTPEDVRKRIGKPWTSTRRELDALTMLGMVECEEEEVEDDDDDEKKKTKKKWLYDLSVDFDRDTLIAMSGGIDPFEAFAARTATVINGGPRDALWQHGV